MAEFTQDQLPSDLFNATSGDVRNYNGQQVKVIVNPNGTRSLIPTSGGSIGGGGGDINSVFDSLMKKMQEANQPAIQALQASKEPLKARYEKLLQDTKISTSNELGKRGILPSSGVAEKEINTASQGVVNDENTQLNAIDQAIANLQSGGNQNAMSSALDLYKFNQNQALQEKQLNAPKQTDPITIPSTGGYVFNPATGAIQTFNKLGGGGDGGDINSFYNNPVSTPSTQKPKYSFMTGVNQSYSNFS